MAGNVRNYELTDADFARFPEMKALDTEVEWRLSKVGAKLIPGAPNNSLVGVGQYQGGDLTFLTIDGDLCVRVGRGLHDYLRTSPIVRIISATADKVEFETEGGEYVLEKNSGI